MESRDEPKEVVMAYIRALDNKQYQDALACLNDRVRIRGPAGETFGKPLDFIEMLRKYQGRYDIKKVFADGGDVCVLYDLVTTGPTVYMSSWYKVKDRQIISIHTVFDPRSFGPPPAGRPGPTGAQR